MAYGLKYFLRYETEVYHRDVQLKIYADGYVGEVFSKKFGAGHIQLTKDIDGKIAGTSLSFDIQSDANFEYSDFFSNNNKKHKVELTYNYKKIWTGYIISDQYSEPYIAPPYDVSIMATDGLGLLKTEDFKLTGFVSRFAAIKYCLNKIGFGFGYLINVDLWESTMNKTGHNMLAQLYFQAEIFNDQNCYDVLQKLLPEDVTITQEWGRWMIQRTADFDKIICAFDVDGVYEMDSTYQPVFSLGSIESGEIYPVGNLTFEFLPAWKNFSIKQVFGKKRSFLKNYDFTAGTENWTKNNTNDFFSVLDLSNGTFAMLYDKHVSTDNYIYNTIALKPTSQITVEISYAPVAYYSWLDGLTTVNCDCKFQIILKDTVSTDIWYLTQFGWQNGGNDLSEDRKIITIQDIQSSLQVDTVDFKTLKIVANKLPESGTVEVRIYQGILRKINPNKTLHYLGVAVKEVLIYSQDLTLFSDSEETKVVLGDDATKKGDTIELMPVDLPVYDNADYYFKNGNFVYSGGKYIPANLWGTNSVRYLYYLAAFIKNQYGSPRCILKGQLRTNGIIISTGTLINSSFGLNARVIHPFYNDKKFTVESGTWHIFEDYYDVKMVELVELDENITITIPEEFNPITTYTRQGRDVLNYTSVGNEGRYRNAIDGSFDIIIPEQANPVVVSRKETITPYQLDYDSGLPQFSIKDSLVETNVGNAANALRIQEGQLISHNYGSMNRSEIANVKNMGETYNPTRTWNIEQTDITLDDNLGYFMYLKIPLDE